MRSLYDHFVNEIRFWAINQRTNKCRLPEGEGRTSFMEFWILRDWKILEDWNLNFFVVVRIFSKLFEFSQICPNFLKIVWFFFSKWSEFFKSCPNLLNIVRIFSKLSKFAHDCPNSLKIVLIFSKLSEFCQSFFDFSQKCPNYLKNCPNFSQNDLTFPENSPNFYEIARIPNKYLQMGPKTHSLTAIWWR